MKSSTFEVVAKLALILCLLIPSTTGATDYTLTVGSLGSGTVTPDNTNNPHPAGVTITLTATPNAGWYFANWSGDTNGAVNPVQVKMNSNLSITGNFLALPSYSLTLVTNGQGIITLNPPGGSYLSNTVVTATATPATGWVFAGWTGGTNTSANPVALTMNGNNSLTGTFAQLPAFDVQPVSVTNIAGSSVIFYGHAVGAMPLVYHWFFSGGTLSGVTTSTILPLTNVSPGQAGTYWLVATNSYGSATSQVASLTVTTTSGPTNVVNSPDEASLRAAIAIGGWVSLGFNGTITLTNTINITSDVILDAKNVTATISGGNAVRLFYVAPGGTFSATNLTFANGSCLITNSAAGTNADAGAIYNDSGTVNLTGCTLKNNSALSLIFGGVARGGAIFNNGGSVLLNQSSISNNAAIGGGSLDLSSAGQMGTGLGGAIFNANGSVVITGCYVSSNLCEGLPYKNSVLGAGGGMTMGGATYQSAGSLTIAKSIFTQNIAWGGGGAFGFVGSVPGSPAFGGALAAIGGSLMIDRCQFFANTARGGAAGHNTGAGAAYGGAVYSANTLAVKDSSFFSNQTLAGIYALGTGADGCGGALYASGTATLNRCSVYSNNVQGGESYAVQLSSSKGGNGLGGGIYNASQLVATNCTIALNSASGGNGESNPNSLNTATGGKGLGGGIFNDVNATFSAMNLTIASNKLQFTSGIGSTNGLAAGCQIANTNGTLRLHNSLVAYSGTNSNAYGPITDDGYNIGSDGSANFASGSSYNFTDPQLAPLGDYGGPTWCMALLPISPAIDFGDSAGIPNTDQRGFVRPFGSGTDIGAFEFGSYLAGVLQLSISAAKTNISLSFTTTPPNVYRLQASTNLIQWTDLNTNGPFASATNISQTISQQGFIRRYFRVLVQ